MFKRNPHFFGSPVISIKDSDIQVFDGDIIFSIITGRSYCSVEKVQLCCGFMLQRDFTNCYFSRFYIDLLRPWILYQHIDLIGDFSHDWVEKILATGAFEKRPIERLSTEIVKELDHKIDVLKATDLVTTENIEKLSQHVINSIADPDYVRATDGLALSPT